MPGVIAALAAALTIEAAGEKVAAWYAWYYGQEACVHCAHHRCRCGDIAEKGEVN